MNGVMFNMKHSYNDFGLILSSKEIKVPKVKTSTIEVPGRDGVLDLTEVLTGRPTYKNQTISFTFSIIDDKAQWPAKYSEMMNYLHGKIMDVILDEDAGYVYTGRAEVNKWKSNKGYGTIVIDVDAEPYKRCVDASNEDYKWDSFCFIDGIAASPTIYNVSGSLTAELIGSKEPVCPTFIIDNAMEITFGDTTHTVTESGTYKFYDIKLVEGINNITFTGNGNVNISYKRGQL